MSTNLLGELTLPAGALGHEGLMQTGQVTKLHYAYEKDGSCTLFGTIEPLTGTDWNKSTPDAPNGNTPYFVKRWPPNIPRRLKSV